MKKLLLLLVVFGCSSPKNPQYIEYEDTLYIDDYTRYVIDKIYNAEKMEDIFPSDTLDEGPSYEEWFNN